MRRLIERVLFTERARKFLVMKQPGKHLLSTTKPKAAGLSQMRKTATAPSPYRPQPVPKVLQTKMQQSQAVAQPSRQPVAPTPYRPQPTPKVLQTKTVGAPAGDKGVGVARNQPVAPPAYRPQPTPRVLQRKTANTTQTPPAKAASTLVVPAARHLQPAGQHRNSLVQPLNTRPSITRQDCRLHASATAPHAHRQAGVLQTKTSGGGSLLTPARPRGVIQLYEGSSADTAREFIRDLLESSILEPKMSLQEAADAIYKFYSEGPQRDEGKQEFELVDSKLWEQGIPKQKTLDNGGFVHIDNPEYKMPNSNSRAQHRMSVHADPKTIYQFAKHLYDGFQGVPAVEKFKIPNRTQKIHSMLDNVVIYYWEVSDGQTRGQILEVLSEAKQYIQREHPAMLASTGMEGVGYAEGWNSFGWNRAEIIAEAYVGYKNKKSLNPSAEEFTTEVFKAFKKRGYDPEDLSKEAVRAKSYCCCCLVTTACTRTLGLPDDCYELETLRWFRDNYVLKLPSGQAEVEEYYSIAPYIIGALDQEADPVDAYRRVYTELVLPVVWKVISGDYRGGFELYKERVLELKSMAAGSLSQVDKQATSSLF